jgi:hypothetical protein
MNHNFHPDDERVDEIRLVTVPRYKTSGFSGDEWRTSVRMELRYKGEVVAESHASDHRSAIMMLGEFFIMSSETDENRWGNTQRLHDKSCDQAGCSEEPVSKYEYLAYYDRLGHKDEVKDWNRSYVQFCQRHLKRGDCGLEDADSNYKVIEGHGSDHSTLLLDEESPSQFGGVIDLRDGN